jgi:hypothetical protein
MMVVVEGENILVVEVGVVVEGEHTMVVEVGVEQS